MATKLKNLKITKVDFVDEGANPDADILLFKRRAEAGAPAESDIGPDKETRSLMKRFIDALRTAFSGALPEEPLEKSATTFSEEYKLRNLEKVTDDMWNLSYALYNSLCSILCDEDLDAAQKQTAMTESVGEFTATVQGAIESWTAGEPLGIVLKDDGEPASDSTISAMKSARDRLSAMIEKSAQESKGEGKENHEAKGEATDMNIGKSKMTPAEKAMLEDFEKRYGIEEGTSPAAEAHHAAPGMGAAIESTEKSAFAAATQQRAHTATEAVPATDGGDVYKGLSPEVRAELESLKKFKEDAEDAALHAVARGYELLGKTDAELFPVLKSLKASSPAAYDQMIAALDSAKAAVEKSGVFDEIGKSGTGSVQPGGAVKEAETKAAELMKSRTGLTYAQAIDEVLQADPELAKRYETED